MHYFNHIENIQGIEPLAQKTHHSVSIINIWPILLYSTLPTTLLEFFLKTNPTQPIFYFMKVLIYDLCTYLT